MNIFWLDSNLNDCAKAHCDKHVVKMVIEYCQMLSTAHHLLGSPENALFQKTHVNHPCALWARECSANYALLWKLCSCLCLEYSRRYKRKHYCEQFVNAGLSKIPAEIALCSLGTIPPLAMPDYIKQLCAELNNFQDVINAYRIYYILEKQKIAVWNHSSKPDWYI